MDELFSSTIEITMEGPVMENMTRVKVRGLGVEEEFYVDHDDAEEFEEPELKIELIMEFAGSGARYAISEAKAINLNGEPVDMDAVESVLQAIKALKR